LNRTRVKICGITRPEDAITAIDAGADAIGLVFWPGSKRVVARERARAIAALAPPSVGMVGVFVDPGVDDVVRAANDIGITAAQICGSRINQDWESVPTAIKIIRSIAVPHTGASLESMRIRGVNDYLADNGATGQLGGSGEAYDWSLANQLKEFGRVWLAGGLTPANVGEAIAMVRPHAVDVSSGVEIAPGVKSPELIRAFIEAVHHADHAMAKGEQNAG
jgi:phosphoribosylanthranilate isomerase